MTAVAEPKKATRKKATKAAKPMTTAEKMAATSAPPPPDATRTAPRPAVNPGEAGYDWSADYPGEKVYVFTASTGATVGLAAVGPKRKFKPGELRKIRHLPNVEQMFFVIERVASPNALAISDEFDDEDYSNMFAQWSEWANTTAGEYSAP